MKRAVMLLAVCAFGLILYWAGQQSTRQIDVKASAPEHSDGVEQSGDNREATNSRALQTDGEAIVSLLETSSSAAAMAATAAAAPTPARVVVRVSDRRDVQVTVTSTSRPAARERVPRFLTGDGKLEVQLAGEGDVVEVEFPSTLRAARVTHDGRTVVSVHGATVLPAEAAGAGILLTQER